MKIVTAIVANASTRVPANTNAKSMARRTLVRKVAASIIRKDDLIEDIFFRAVTAPSKPRFEAKKMMPCEC